MHRLKIKKLGPIEECELTCSRFMTLTGFQAPGKSTVAKATQSGGGAAGTAAGKKRVMK